MTLQLGEYELRKGKRAGEEMRIRSLEGEEGPRSLREMGT
jgi:hypothetical protein